MNNIRYTQPNLPTYISNTEPVTYSEVSISSDKLRKNKDLDVYELHVKFMHGDADWYTYSKFTYKNNAEGIQKLIGHGSFLHSCMLNPPNGGDEGYWDVPGYDKFGEGNMPSDSEWTDGHASLVGFGVIYIDKNGVEYPVDLK